MPLAKNIMQGGLSAGTADAINGQVATALTAAGTTQGTGLALSADICAIGTCASGAGVTLFAGQSGDSQLVYNGGANSCNVYPPVGSRINVIAVNGAHILGTATACRYTTLSATQIIGELSA